MRPLRALAYRLPGLFRQNRRERELADEIDSHLQLHIEDNLRAGMSPEEARRYALLKLGGMTPTMQSLRERATVPWIEHLLQDLRFAVRQMRKNLGFACTAILMLTLGMCACVSIFAFVDAALIQPLPYPNPSRLTGVYESTPQCPRCNLSYPDYLDWKKLNKDFVSLEAYTGGGFTVSTPSGAQVARAARVSAGFFRALGVTPPLGRDFHAGEDLPGAAPAVVLSYAIWQSRYGGRSDIIGQIATLDTTPYVIIGVLPRDFHFAPSGPAEYWVPLTAAGSCEQRRSCHNLYGVARLKDGVSIQAALADTAVIARQLETQYPDSNRGQGANVVPLTEVIVGDVRPILLVLLGGAGLLLMIACVNVTSLLLVRSESRRREMAVRSALGASRVRLIRQFVTEGLVLVTAGSVLGVALAAWAMQLLSRLIPAEMMERLPFLRGLGLNFRVLVFACAIALLAAVLFALTPTLRLSFAQIRDGLAEGSRGSAGNTWRRLGSKLVVVELATAVVLLVGAGLLGQSLYRLLRVEIGFQASHLVTLEIFAPDASYGKDPQAMALGRQIVTRISNLPGVRSAALVSVLPVNYNGNTDWIRFAGKPYNGEHNEVNERDVSSDFFSTLGAKLLRGRYFTDAEDLSKPHVAIVNRTLAKKYFGSEDPIGKQYGDTALSPKSIRTIVGVVDDIREGALDSEIWPAEYLPFNQSPGNDFNLIVRTSQAGESILPSLAATIRDIDRGIVAFSGTSMQKRIEDSPSAYIRRSSAWLVGGFAAMALLMGVVGLYGVISYSVSQRTREIGVRIALGAQRGMVYRLILREAGWMTAAGIFGGIVGSLAATSLMRNLLFGIQSWDVPTILAVAAVLAIAALLASYVPARRAAAVNPVDALRAE